MAGLFAAEVVGRIGIAPEVRQGQNGAYIYFRVAANLSSSSTQWFACYATQDILSEETLSRMLVGAEVFVRAKRVSIRAFTASSGTPAYTVGLEVSDVSVLHYPENRPAGSPAMEALTAPQSVSKPETSITDYYKNFDL